MAETKEGAKPSGSKSSAQPTTPTSSKAQDVFGSAADAYFNYAEGIRQGRSSLQQSYGEAYRAYLDTLRVAGTEAEARVGEAYRQLQTATQDSQKLMAEGQQALIRAAYAGTSDSSGSAQASSHLNTFEEVQRRQEEAYRTFCDELRASWDAAFQRRSQEAYRSYTDALQGMAGDANRAAQDATRAYLQAVKDYWAQLDVDAAASNLHRDTIRK